MRSARDPVLSDGERSRTRVEGFTLVELLVVITIIAILSVIGITIFTGVQKGARDARRRADIDAIATAMEANYSGLTGKYTPLSETMFASGKIPKDPLAFLDQQYGPSVCQGRCWYCAKTTSLDPLTPGPGSCSGSEENIDDPTKFPFLPDQTKYMVCAGLESGTSSYYCRSNQQ